MIEQKIARKKNAPNGNAMVPITLKLPLNSVAIQASTATVPICVRFNSQPSYCLLAFRFSFAAIILAVICIPKFKHYTKDLLFSGMKMGTAMFFEFFLFTVALQYTSASKSSFIIASYIIILPIVYLIIRRKKPTGSDVLASVICMVGICLLLANGLDSFNKGDLLSAGCALSYAVHIVYPLHTVQTQEIWNDRAENCQEEKCTKWQCYGTDHLKASAEQCCNPGKYCHRSHLCQIQQPTIILFTCISIFICCNHTCSNMYT